MPELPLRLAHCFQIMAARTPPQRAPDSDRPARRSGPGYPGEKARQGEIILRTPGRRAVFIGGLIALVLTILILGALGLR